MGSLLTQDDIAEILNMDDSSDIPEQIVDWAELEVEKITGKNYISVTDAEWEFYLTIDRQNYLQMPELSSLAITKIEYYQETTVEWVTIQEADYHFEQETGMIFFDYELYRRQRYKVTHSYGGDAPTELEKKLHFLLVYDYMIKHKSSVLSAEDVQGQAVKEKIGDYSIEYNIKSAKSKPELIADDIKSTIALIGGDQTGESNYQDTELV